ncbi:MAG: type II secretion system F family protein [Lachnospiraceae bacterium]|nr:type II secretion system F family protein [Lachnospiraceae bacterium]
MWVETVIFAFLFLGCVFLFLAMKRGRVLRRALSATREVMDKNKKLRLLKNRQRLSAMNRNMSLMQKLDRFLEYSTVRLKLKWLSAEVFLMINLVMAAVLLSGGALLGLGMAMSICLIFILIFTQFVILFVMKERAFKQVDGDMIKLMDFLGNYSITGGELASILYRVSRYLDEPLKGALEKCFYEANTTGDLSLALMGLMDSVEHKKFKELILNLEAGIRYSADLSKLLKESRRDVREYQSSLNERKSLMGEALVELAILVVLSVVILFFAGKIMELSVIDILLFTTVGRVALGIVSFVFLLYGIEIVKLGK